MRCVFSAVRFTNRLRTGYTLYSREAIITCADDLQQVVVPAKDWLGGGIGNGGFPAADDEFSHEGMAKGLFQSPGKDMSSCATRQ